MLCVENLAVGDMFYEAVDTSSVTLFTVTNIVSNKQYYVIGAISENGKSEEFWFGRYGPITDYYDFHELKQFDGKWYVDLGAIE